MPQETLGYVRLEWTCPSCGSRNPGPQKTCTNCGAPQPQDVQFEQAAEEKLITDQAELARAAAGPDVHCPYCGSRNPAGRERCTQCGGDLEGGQARARGRVVGAHRSGPAAPVNCPACGAANPATAMKCAKCGASLADARRKPQAPAAPPPPKTNRGLLIGCGVVVALAFCAILGLALSGMLTPAKDVIGQVRAVAWTRTIAVEALAPVTLEGWRDEVPAGAALGSCSRRYHHTQDSPAADSEKVCGTPYTVDEGSGYGKVVQDCEYRVYADWCRYTVQEWQAVDEATAEGSDLSPRWPDLRLSAGQREGAREEAYRVVFLGDDDKQYTYQLRSASDFARFGAGSRWSLKVRGSTVVSAEPAD